MVRTNEEFSVPSDLDLQQRVRAFLDGHNVPALRRVAVQARGGTITLHGKVSSFYEKQLSQQCSRRVLGVRQVIDEIVVKGLRSTESGE